MAKGTPANRLLVLVEGEDLLGPKKMVVDGGRSNAGRPKRPVRLMASLVYAGLCDGGREALRVRREGCHGLDNA